MMTKGSNWVQSQAGLIEPTEYRMKTGFIALSVRKAPALKLRICEPFEHVPSGKMRKGEYSPVSSISFYLFEMASLALYLDSSVPPLGMYILSTAFNKLLMKGTWLNSSLGAKAGKRLFKRTIPSNQLT